MEATWFTFVAFTITMYVVLDGFDLGVGAVHLFVARTDEERREVLASIGPVWDGNEVWLLAAGGTLFLAFPSVYASAFSGFYLPLMVVLWLLILRGISVELRSHLDGPVWRPIWDVVFAGASSALALFFGAALGNVVRGVPLGPDGHFFEPLWTDFGTRGELGVLDGYTVLVGGSALIFLALHGSLWLVHKTRGAVAERASRIAHRLWFVTVLAVAFLTVATFRIQPAIPERIFSVWWPLLFPVLALTGLASIWVQHRRGNSGRAFLSSCVFLTGMMASMAAGLFPNLLPSTIDPSHSMTAYNSGSGAYGLSRALFWWIPGILLAIGYFLFLYRHVSGKVELGDGGH